MKRLLFRLFIKDDKDILKPSVRAAIGKLSGTVGIVCNLLLSAGKLAVGIVSGAVSVIADGLNNLSDAASAIVTLIGFKLAERPADEEHPFGHARFEYLSALAVAGMIVVIGFEMAKSSVEKLLSGTQTEVSPLLGVVLLLAVGVKFWMYLFNRFLGKQIDSPVLLAAAADSRNDCIATLSVLLAALVEKVSGWRVDGIAGLGVSVFILISGIRMARQTLDPLLGEPASAQLQALIVDYISEHPKVLGYHDLMVHDYGPGQRFASLHVEMDRNEDPLTCHEIIDDMERECWKSHNIHLVIHYDPVITDDPELTRLQQVVGQLLQQQDSRLCLHDFRMATADGCTNLIFDVVLPAELQKSKNQIKAKLEEELAKREPANYRLLITFDTASPC